MRSQKILICVGNGGVGKTTVSASLGVKAAQAGLKVLVLTIDPARRLATSLGIKEDMDGEVLVPKQNFKGQLYTEMIRPEKIFEKFVKESSHGKERGDRLLKNSLYRQLATKLSGSQEFTSLERLHAAHKSGKYDLIILDTPPAQHAVDFLEAPQKIYGLFEETITQWFGSDRNNKGFFEGLFNKGALKVLGVLEKITGSEFIMELGDFFDSIKGMQEVIRKRSADVHRLLTSSETSFILVTGYGDIQLDEAENFYQELRRGGYNLSLIIASRTYPFWINAIAEEDQQRLVHVDPENGSVEKLNNLCSKFIGYHLQRKASFERRISLSFEGTEILQLPAMGSDVFGLADLEKLSEYLVINR